MDKITKIREERAKLAEIFKEIDPTKAKLIAGLLDEAAYLLVENEMLRGVLVETGMIKVHPQHPDIQKPVEAARQYRQNVNSYAVVIKTLNGILAKDGTEGEDEFDKFMRERQSSQ